MIFYINIKSGYKNHKLMVEYLPVNDRIERFKVSGKDKYVVLESNRPFFRNRGIKHRKPDWTIYEGSVKYGGGLLDDVQHAINKIYP